VSINAAFAIATIVIKELYRRKDFYVLFILTAVLTISLGSINFFNDDRIVRFLKEACLLLIWIASLAIALTTTARQIPMERESRTIFPLLAKPVSRWDLILGKFLGCWLACGLALFVFYLFFAIISGSKEHAWPMLQYFQAAWFHWIFLAVVISMALLGSVVFAAPSSNSTICFVIVVGILFVARHLNQIAMQEPEPLGTVVYTLYYLIPHLEFFDVRDLVIHEAALIAWGPWLLATIYGLFYASFFLLASWFAFRRKPLN
jgi:ABC-type transport system involved in multi-copper enzyme maturation permease subunit